MALDCLANILNPCGTNDMATKNDITGDSIRSKGTTKAYSDNWELIFGKNKSSEESVEDKDPPPEVTSRGKES